MFETWMKYKIKCIHKQYHYLPLDNLFDAVVVVLIDEDKSNIYK